MHLASPLITTTTTTTTNLGLSVPCASDATPDSGRLSGHLPGQTYLRKSDAVPEATAGPRHCTRRWPERGARYIWDRPGPHATAT